MNSPTNSNQDRNANRWPNGSLETRFMCRVEISESCWIWKSSKNTAGYGRTNLMGRGHKTQFAHRLSWELFVGKINDGMNILHTCDNPSCVRPSHLSIGTQSDNIVDAVRKGRHRNTKKNSCKNGHPLNGSNLVMRGKSRACRICRNANSLRLYYVGKVK